MIRFFYICLLLVPATLTYAQTDQRGMKTISGTATATAKRTALVIGNASYAKAGTLRNPLNDARAMDRVLRNLGFRVTLHTNLNRAGLEDAINTWGKALGEDDVALFYYAGHGMEANGINYLMPTDANPQNQAQVKLQATPVEMVTGWMDEARTKTNIVLLDACRNNPFARSWSRNTSNGGLTNMTAPSGTFVGFAASPGKTAADGERINGLYTEAILKHIQSPNQTIDQIFTKVSNQVTKSSGNTQIPFRNSSLTADFYFVQTTTKPVNRPEPEPPVSQSPSITPSVTEPVPPVSQPVIIPPVTNPLPPTTTATSTIQKEALLQLAEAKTKKIKGLRTGKTVWRSLGVALTGLGTYGAIIGISDYNYVNNINNINTFGYYIDNPFPWFRVIAAGTMAAGTVVLFAKPLYKTRIKTLEQEANQLRQRANTLSFTPAIHPGGQGLAFGGTLRYSF
jgi:Caspase domain